MKNSITRRSFLATSAVSIVPAGASVVHGSSVARPLESPHLPGAAPGLKASSPLLPSAGPKIFDMAGEDIDCSGSPHIPP